MVLPFKKITTESFKNEKTIKDFISYNIFTTIEIGVELQLVGFFLDQTEASFSFQKRLVSFNSSKSKEVMELYHNMSNFWFDIHKSKETLNCDLQQICSELFHFNTFSNSKVEATKFKFNIDSDFLNEKYICGVIGLKNPSNSYYEKKETIFFFDELKSHKLIDEKIFTILYNEKKDVFNCNEDIFQGQIIIGESPHKFYPTKFTSTDEITGYGYLTEEIVLPGIGYVFLVNELKFNSTKGIYLESDVNVEISFSSGFIKGTNLYRKEIHKVFFEDLIKNQLCKIEYLEENVYTNKYFIYSCNNDQEILNKIKHFPPLYLEIKTQNLKFIFTYEDLFKQFNNRIYFLIAFKDEKYYVFSSKWYLGEIFLRKYITSFDYDSKSIIFYPNQVNDANLNSKTIYEKKEKEKEKHSNVFGVLRILLEIFMGIFIIFMIYIFYRKIRSKRKLHANELEDNNFIYDSKKEKNYGLFENE